MVTAVLILLGGLTAGAVALVVLQRWADVAARPEPPPAPAPAGEGYLLDDVAEDDSRPRSFPDRRGRGRLTVTATHLCWTGDDGRTWAVPVGEVGVLGTVDRRVPRPGFSYLQLDVRGIGRVRWQPPVGPLTGARSRHDACRAVAADLVAKGAGRGFVPRT
jgi:hypothetical protein